MSDTTATTHNGSAAARDQAHPVYVYGIIPAADAEQWPEMPGLGDPFGTVRTIVQGEIAALVSDLPPDTTPGRPADLEAHRRVLSQAIERGTAIPMRFGIVMDGDDTVRERLLTRHATELSDVLHRLDGQVQMTVRAFYADDALLRDVLAAQPELAQESAALAQRPEAEVRTARVRLGELVAKAVEARRAEVESALLSRLSPLAAEVLVDPPSSERVALTAQLLIDRDRRAALDDEIREMGDALKGLLAFRYIGPLAPFSFADLALDGDEEPEAWD
jgi:hypothetical protein